MRRIHAVLIILPILALSALPVLEPFLHNHAIGDEENRDCPVYLWLKEFNTTISIFVFIPFLYLISLFIPAREESRSLHIIALRSIRAPPANASL